jgi:dsRNA-specific ribonuclease
MKKKIKELFASLPKAEQVELLKELSSNSGTSISIADFSTKHQKRYNSNIEFNVKQTGLDHAPTITATVHTAFGNFEGKGSNQKIAKANAIDIANTNWR